MATNCTISDGDIKSDSGTGSIESLETDAELQKMSLEFFKLIDESRVDTPSFTPISREECERVIEDEKVVLTSIYESFKYLSEDNNTFEVNISFGDSRIGKEDEISITFQLPPDYPNSIPIFEINNSQSQILSFNGTDLLYDQLLQSAFDQRGTPMLYNLVQLAHESCEKVILFNKEHLLHQSLLDQVNYDMQKSVLPAAADTSKAVESLSPISPQSPVMDPQFHPSSFISLRGIIEACKSCNYSIRGVENILRPDLAQRFMNTQQKLSKMEKKYRKVKNISCTPEIVYHGTSENNLPSIVSKGLLVPGTEKVRVVHGSAYGVGIYVGKSPMVSLGYSSCSKLLVCALLPGKLVSSYFANGSEYEVYDGHSFYVIRNPSQLLPCWVISVQPEQQNETSLGLLSAATKSATSTHPNNDTELSGEDKQALLEARMRKFLPFGFGPGNRTVILEAGDWDDDDDAILEGRETDESIILDYGVVQEENTQLQHFRFMDEDSLEPAESQ